MELGYDPVPVISGDSILVIRSNAPHTETSQLQCGDTFYLIFESIRFPTRGFLGSLSPLFVDSSRISMVFFFIGRAIGF